MYRIAAVACAVLFWFALSYTDRVHMRERSRRLGILLRRASSEWVQNSGFYEYAIVQHYSDAINRAYLMMMLWAFRPLCIMLEMTTGFAEGVQNIEPLYTLELQDTDPADNTNRIDSADDADDADDADINDQTDDKSGNIKDNQNDDGVKNNTTEIVQRKDRNYKKIIDGFRESEIDDSDVIEINTRNEKKAGDANDSDSEDNIQNIDSDDSDSEDSNNEHADSEDADSEDSDSEDADSEDADSEDSDSQDSSSDGESNISVEKPKRTFNRSRVRSNLPKPTVHSETKLRVQGTRVRRVAPKTGAIGGIRLLRRR